jgi:hypothetical protein
LLTLEISLRVKPSSVIEIQRTFPIT